jgi:hypothetical protein
MNLRLGSLHLHNAQRAMFHLQFITNLFFVTFANCLFEIKEAKITLKILPLGTVSFNKIYLQYGY